MLTVPEIAFDEADDLLTVAEVAAIFGRSQGWVRGKVAIGTIPRATAGRRILISRDMVRAVLANRRLKAPEVPKRHLRLVVDNT